MSLVPILPASPDCINRLTLENPDLAYVFGPDAVRDPAAQAFRSLLGVTGAGADCDQILAALRARRNQIEQGAATIAGSAGGGVGALLRQQQRDEALLAASAVGASLTGLPVGPRGADAIDELAQQACASGWANATRDQVNLIYDRAIARGIPGARSMTLAQVCTAIAEEAAEDAAEEVAAATAAAAATPPPPLALYGTAGAAATNPYYYAGAPYAAQAAPWYGPYGVARSPAPYVPPPAPSAAAEVAAADAEATARDARNQAQAYDNLAQQLRLQSEATAAQAAEAAAQAAQARTLSQVQRGIATATMSRQAGAAPLYGANRGASAW
ncbi:hypothetical protein pdul_cds_189 [Pandoravirus dulcis]|uniref:Uncharacterized protein n=1 Tax=Pandoravirus dulcis TaxID=1349409 RepID=S4VPA1_9VIRU|nr:hypothetical protein pdul_cds_189 [Pandoravirus dulcis]AGO82118.1 hypothetical protein pdul_cds_189 [Pandoravirus dulcis]